MAAEMAVDAARVLVSGDFTKAPAKALDVFRTFQEWPAGASLPQAVRDIFENPGEPRA
jgi:hypothetical protein